MKVEFTKNQVEVMQKALGIWGLKAQVGVTVEECAELIKAAEER